MDPAPEDEPALLWERAEPSVRPAPVRLSREKIVRAAIAIADRDGLAAVSLRKVGASLDAGPMRLYGYLATKDDLLDLMVDAVYGEMLSSGPVQGGWRDVFRTIARRTRAACRAHAWLIDLLGSRPHLGPNALGMLEASLAALTKDTAFADIDAAMRAMNTVNAYVIGALRSERRSGLNEAEWQNIWLPYLERVVAAGRSPMLAKVVRDGHRQGPDAAFIGGLKTVLDGLAAGLPPE